MPCGIGVAFIVDASALLFYSKSKIFLKISLKRSENQKSTILFLPDSRTQLILIIWQKGCQIDEQEKNTIY